MAEFNFYGNWEDSVEILHVLSQERKYKFVIDMAYKQDPPLSFVDLGGAPISELKKSTRVFIWSTLYSVFPPKLESFLGEIKKINFLSSGPALDLKLVICGITKGIPQIGHGWLDCPLNFFHPETNEQYKPDINLKKHFILMKRTIQKLMEKRYFLFRRITAEGEIKPFIQTIWIGKHGLQMLESGNHYILLASGERLSFTELAMDKKEIRMPIDED